MSDPSTTILHRRPSKTTSVQFGDSPSSKIMADAYDLMESIQPDSTSSSFPTKKKSDKGAVCIAVCAIIFMLTVLVGTELIGVFITKSGLTYRMLGLKSPSIRQNGAQDKSAGFPGAPWKRSVSNDDDFVESQIEAPPTVPGPEFQQQPTPVNKDDYTDNRAIYIDEDQQGFIDGMVEIEDSRETEPDAYHFHFHGPDDENIAEAYPGSMKHSED